MKSSTDWKRQSTMLVGISGFILLTLAAGAADTGTGLQSAALMGLAGLIMLVIGVFNSNADI